MEKLVFKVTKQVYMDDSKSYFVEIHEQGQKPYVYGRYDNLEDAKDGLSAAKVGLLGSVVKSTETVHKESI